MWMNGSRSVCETPAKPRRTGKPSPSKPTGGVGTDRTGRCVPAARWGTGIRGSVSVSAVQARITSAPSTSADVAHDRAVLAPRRSVGTGFGHEESPSAGTPIDEGVSDSRERYLHDEA